MSSIRFRFNHGLGDCVHLCHALPLWIRRDFKIEVATNPFFHPLIIAAGATVCDDAEDIHPWMHSLTPPLPFSPLSGNKTVANLYGSPLPPIGYPHELWEEMLAVRLRLPKSETVMPEWSKQHPLIVCHLKGASGLINKNLPDHTIADIWRGILSSRLMRDGIVVNVNEERQASLFADNRVRNLSIADEGWTLLELAALLDRADLTIGIDSGILHACRLTDAPALGIWTAHQPWAFALPRERTRHLCGVPAGLPESVVRAYNLVPAERGQLSGEAVARVALDMIERKGTSDGERTFAAVTTTVQAAEPPAGPEGGTAKA